MAKYRHEQWIYILNDDKAQSLFVLYKLGRLQHPTDWVDVVHKQSNLVKTLFNMLMIGLLIQREDGGFYFTEEGEALVEQMQIYQTTQGEIEIRWPDTWDENE